MVIDIISVIGLVIFVALFAKIIENIRKRNKRESSDRISFKETLDLVELPIITFKNGDKKINFLLDTGASKSTINKSALKELKYKVLNKEDTVYGADGNKTVESFISMDINYKDRIYTDEFQTVNLDKAFSNLKNDFGVNLSGILGNSFFQKYKYIIDFDELVAYSVE